MTRTTPAHTKHPSEVRNCAVSFDYVLDDGELLTGTPSIASVPSGLTFANAKVNTVALTINGITVAIGKAVQFKVSGGTSGVQYQMEVSCATDASPAQTIYAELELLVLNR
jgi:hypothetical protein